MVSLAQLLSPSIFIVMCVLNTMQRSPLWLTIQKWVDMDPTVLLIIGFSFSIG